MTAPLDFQVTINPELAPLARQAIRKLGTDTDEMNDRQVCEAAEVVLARALTAVAKWIRYAALAKRDKEVGKRVGLKLASAFLDAVSEEVERG